MLRPCAGTDVDSELAEMKNALPGSVDGEMEELKKMLASDKSKEKPKTEG